MSESQAEAGPAAVPASAPAASTAFNPDIEFDDGEDAGAGEAAESVAEPRESAAPDGGGDGADEVEQHKQFGYMPCYRTFQKRWFWEEGPWDIAHLFMDLLLRANRKMRRVKVGRDLIEIGRGMVATSYSKLAEVTGHDRKTIRKWLELLAKDGEVSVQNKGQHGVLITICKYGSYALDNARAGQQDGQRSGQKGGRRSPQR